MAMDEPELDEKQRGLQSGRRKMDRCHQEGGSARLGGAFRGEVDKWEAAHFAEDNVRNEVKAAKRRCPAPQVLRILLLRRPQGLSDFTRSPPITAD